MRIISLILLLFLPLAVLAEESSVEENQFPQELQSHDYVNMDKYELLILYRDALLAYREMQEENIRLAELLTQAQQDKKKLIDEIIELRTALKDCMNPDNNEVESRWWYMQGSAHYITDTEEHGFGIDANFLVGGFWDVMYFRAGLEYAILDDHQFVTKAGISFMY